MISHTNPQTSPIIDEETVWEVINEIMYLQPQFFRNVTLNFNTESKLYDIFVKMIARGVEQKVREEALAECQDSRQSVLPGVAVE